MLVLEWFHDRRQNAAAEPIGETGFTAELLDAVEAKDQLEGEIANLSDPDIIHEDPSIYSITAKELIRHGLRNVRKYDDTRKQIKFHNNRSLEKSDTSLPVFRQALDLFRRALLEEARLGLNELDGDYSQNISDKFFLKAPQHNFFTKKDRPFSALVKEYLFEIDRKEITRGTRQNYRSCLEVIEDFFGKDTPVSEISRRSCRNFREALQRIPKGAQKRGLAEMLKEEGEPSPSNTVSTAP